jgi:hypothetical protein
MDRKRFSQTLSNSFSLQGYLDKFTVKGIARIRAKERQSKRAKEAAQKMKRISPRNSTTIILSEFVR